MSLLFDVPTTATQAQSISAALLKKNWSPIGPISPEIPGNISPIITFYEILGHLQRALDLIRTSWGWYPNNPNGTSSTVIEDYLANGMFRYRSNRGNDYDASYVSHSHGWFGTFQAAWSKRGEWLQC
jgi:hypothetical protein